jgi:F0F1-type ATP synthase assembly protein I
MVINSGSGMMLGAGVGLVVDAAFGATGIGLILGAGVGLVVGGGFEQLRKPRNSN